MNSQFTLDQKDFDTQMDSFAKNVANIVQGLHGKTVDEIKITNASCPLLLEGTYIAAVQFVGSAFGEMLLCIENTAAEAIFMEPDAEDPLLCAENMGDSLCEILNMAAGASLKTLLSKFEKLTIAAPRLVSGKIRFPGIQAKTAILNYGKAKITLALYIDTMRLDIADSYRQGLENLREANQNLLDANEKLKSQQMQLVHSEKMASLGTMAAGVAHEINNPLAFVLSNTDVLSTYVEAFHKLFDSYHRLAFHLSQRDAKETLEKLKHVQSLESETDIEFILQDTINLIYESKSGLDRIRGIVGGLKRFSRVDDAGMKFVQINDELRNTLQLLNHEIKYRAKIELQLGEIPEIRCSPGELGQVFMNIILNAAQALPDSGGTITISTEDTKESVVVKISDTGCGIPTENLHKIFNPFFTTKPVGKGTGLGLSISHGIVQKHGGNMFVASELGKGTTFSIKLPYLGTNTE